MAAPDPRIRAPERMTPVRSSSAAILLLTHVRATRRGVLGLRSLGWASVPRLAELPRA